MSFEFFVISVFVLVGSIFQVATGVGLGLIAGPILLYFIDSHSALQIALTLNLLLTLLLLPFDFRQMSPSHLASLSLWGLVGFPFGFMLFLALDQALLKILAATVILLAVIQLQFLPGGTASTDTERDATKSIKPRLGGIVAGAMTSTLAMPGPMALWSLLCVQLDPLRIRATLRAYFAAAYSLGLLLHIVWFGIAALSFSWTLKLLPTLLVGIAAGLMARKHFNRQFLLQLFKLLLAAMGIALLCKGIVDVI